MTPSKSHLALALLAFTGWGAFWLSSKRPPLIASDRIVYVDRIVHKTSSVHKSRTKTETRPDGTKIVTETKVASEERVQETEKRRQIERSTSKLPTYSLGLSVVIDPTKPLDRDYLFEAGHRVLQTPIWLTFGYQTDRKLLLGAKYEF